MIASFSLVSGRTIRSRASEEEMQPIIVDGRQGRRCPSVVERTVIANPKDRYRPHGESAAEGILMYVLEAGRIEGMVSDFSSHRASSTTAQFLNQMRLVFSSFCGASSTTVLSNLCPESLSAALSVEILHALKPGVREMIPLPRRTWRVFVAIQCFFESSRSTCCIRIPRLMKLALGVYLALEA